MAALTSRQRELLAYIGARELCPTFEEMRLALKVKSKATVHKNLAGLERAGHIRRLRHRERAIEIVRPGVPSLRVVFGPKHFEMRAAEKRRLWAREG